MQLGRYNTYIHVLLVYTLSALNLCTCARQKDPTPHHPNKVINVRTYKHNRPEPVPPSPSVQLTSSTAWRPCCEGRRSPMAAWHQPLVDDNCQH